MQKIDILNKKMPVINWYQQKRAKSQMLILFDCPFPVNKRACGSLWMFDLNVTRGEMEPPQCVEELEDDVFQPEDGEPGAQPRRLLSADLFAQSQLDCPLSRLQLFPLTHCCGPGLRPTSQEDKATQTLSPASPSQGVMLPCGVTEEPQRLFYGNAGYRLPLPASFPAGLPLGDQPPEGQWQHRAEIQIARKLQCIADQFHRLHMQQHQQNRNRMWWQILLFLHNVALNGDENRNGAGPR
ncbi:hypothetical protein MJG53_008280 [Ovis ammon polii x Ovis aries]|nr:hypothetical protein MJG53_008280 [Ovis ammon polii x Ovis aries]